MRPFDLATGPMVLQMQDRRQAPAGVTDVQREITSSKEPICPIDLATISKEP